MSCLCTSCKDGVCYPWLENIGQIRAFLIRTVRLCSQCQSGNEWPYCSPWGASIQIKIGIIFESTSVWVFSHIFKSHIFIRLLAAQTFTRSVSIRAGYQKRHLSGFDRTSIPEKVHVVLIPISLPSSHHHHSTVKLWCSTSAIWAPVTPLQSSNSVVTKRC